MSTTFNVISLGVPVTGSGATLYIDPTEGNTNAENAAQLVGRSFGGPGDSIAADIETLTPGSGGGGNGYYEQNNNQGNETFRIDGGPLHTFDAAATYNATITYANGATAMVTAVVFQDTAGNLYFAPEQSNNTDQTSLEAHPIQSLHLDSLESSNYSGLTADRPTSGGGFVTCFTEGALIATARGLRQIEAIRPGHRVATRDRGLQPVRWIGCATVAAQGKLAPVRIAAGALGCGLPERAMRVSRQHRMLLASPIAERMTGAREVLVPAIKLVGLPGVTVEASGRQITYLHLLLDHHEVIAAEGAPSESLLTGPQALAAIGPEARGELKTLFPELVAGVARFVRPVPQAKVIRKLIARHAKNRRPLLAA